MVDYKITDSIDGCGIHPSMLRKIKATLGINSEDFDFEIDTLVKAASADMKIAGVKCEMEKPLCFQAIVYYCKANFRNNENSDKYRKVYESLKMAMSLAEEYRDDG